MNSEATELISRATSAVESFGHLPLGDAYALAQSAAETEIARLMSAASDKVFPQTLAPISAATVADLAWCLDSLPVTCHEFVGAVVDLHAAALDQHGELASALRGLRGRWRLIAALEATETNIERRPIRVRDGLEAFELATARQLEARSELRPWSTILASVVPDLRRRLQACSDGHKAHAVAAVAAVEAKQSASETALTAARREYRAGLVARAQRLFRVSAPGESEMTSGLALARKIESAADDRLHLYERAIVGAEAMQEASVGFEPMRTRTHL